MVKGYSSLQKGSLPLTPGETFAILIPGAADSRRTNSTKGNRIPLQRQTDIWMNVRRKQGLFGLRRQDSVCFTLRCGIVLPAADDLLVLNHL